MQIRDHQNANTLIHLLFSKQEHTYAEHIMYLLDDLDKWNISYTTQIEQFGNHNDVGNYFIPFIKDEMNKVLANQR